MQYQTKMTAEQLKAAAEWASGGDGFADVLFDTGDDDRIVVGQGDERVTFNMDGAQCCERCGALDGEELQGGACYSCGLGHEDDPEAASTHADVDERCNNGLCEKPRGHDGPCTRRAVAGSHEPEGDRIAREGRAMLAAACDVDYDPAAEDEDGVPLFSEQTRAEVAGDPRGERDR
jgi:hypothetical protein